MSVISGTIAAMGARKSAQEQNALTAQQNQSMLNMELFARGAPLSGSSIPADLQGQSSALLPYYFGDTEQSLGTDASDMYKAIQERNGAAGPALANYDALLGKYGSANTANRSLVNNLASGRMTDQTLSEAAPVFQGRLDVASSRRNAGLEALRSTLSEIDSIQSGKGYSGDSTGNQMLRFNARRAIGRDSATDLAGANLANAQERQSIQSGGRAMQLSNISLPDAMARADINRTRLPVQALTAQQGDAMSPFNFFRMGEKQFSRPTTLEAMPNTTGEIANAVAQTGAQIGGAIGKYYSNKSISNQASYQNALQSGQNWSSSNPGPWE